MCGIFGYSGAKNAAPEIVKGLQRLEYRGYDSAGVCTIDSDRSFVLNKAVGKVMELKNKVDAHGGIASVGIGHTRWATHGGVTELNCHPHTSSNGRFAVVHNGIIENYSELKKELEAKGHVFYGQTDTEVVGNSSRISLPETILRRLVEWWIQSNEPTHSCYSIGKIRVDSSERNSEVRS